MKERSISLPSKHLTLSIFKTFLWPNSPWPTESNYSKSILSPSFEKIFALNLFKSSEIYLVWTHPLHSEIFLNTR